MSTLPKTEFPIHDIFVPSKKTKFKFRPFLVKEEKILLMSKQGENSNDILKTMLQVVNNCNLHSSLNVGNLPPFDVMWIYLQLRKISVGGVIEQRYKDPDGKTYSIKVIIDEIKLTKPPATDFVLPLDSERNRAIKMRYPSTNDVITIENSSNLTLEERENAYLLACLETLYNKDSVYDLKNEKPEEILECIDGMPDGTYAEISAFFENIPSLTFETSYTNAEGLKRDISLATIEDFFI